MCDVQKFLHAAIHLLNQGTRLLLVLICRPLLSNCWRQYACHFEVAAELLVEEGDETNTYDFVQIGRLVLAAIAALDFRVYTLPLPWLSYNT